MSCVFLALSEGKVETGELVGEERRRGGVEGNGDKRGGIEGNRDKRGGIILGKSEKISGECEVGEGAGLVTVHVTVKCHPFRSFTI